MLKEVCRSPSVTSSQRSVSIIVSSSRGLFFFFFFFFFVLGEWPKSKVRCDRVDMF